MSLLYPQNGTECNYRLSRNVGRSSLAEHARSEPDSHYQFSRRRHKHKKHKKHRREKIRYSHNKDNNKSKGKLADGNISSLHSLLNDDKNSGDYLKKEEEFSGPLEEMADFTWLTTEFKFSDITDTFESEAVATASSTNITSRESELSQRDASSPSFTCTINEPTDRKDERALIEQEIQEKYAEMDALFEKINSKRHRSKRKRKYHLRKYDSKDSGEDNAWISTSVNIYPIKREKRCAQSIREALLVRTAMKKAWKGVLGSCCGKGCWATWKWISLRGVISDYE